MSRKIFRQQPKNAFRNPLSIRGAHEPGLFGSLSVKDNNINLNYHSNYYLIINLSNPGTVQIQPSQSLERLAVNLDKIPANHDLPLLSWRTFPTEHTLPLIDSRYMGHSVTQLGIKVVSREPSGFSRARRELP
jgi:hypothetical protein